MAKSNAHQFAVRLMEHLVVPTFVLDPDGRVMIWNKACERLTNVMAEDVIGTKDHWSAFYEEPRACLADLFIEDRTDEIDSLYATSSIKKDVYDGIRAENWAVMPKAGNTLYLAINSGPIYDEDGTLIAVVETLRDMTEQKKAEEALQSLAHKDGLTGLANRRSFDISLEADILHAIREHHSISLILCDVDHFKAYNDTYGHHDGDECLKVIAKAVGQHALRATDLAARYGGEEFAIILPTSEGVGAARVADRVRQAIYDMKLEHSASATQDRVTASFGVAAIVPKPGFEPSKLIEMADQALYKAKENGRNQVFDYNDLDVKT